MLESRLYDLTGERSWFAHAQAADSVTRKPDLNRPLGGFPPQRMIHAALHNAEQRLRRPEPFRGRCPHLPGRAQLGRLVLGKLTVSTSGELALARPDGGVRAYMVCGFNVVCGSYLVCGPGDFLFVLLKIFLAALSPPQRELHGLPRPLSIRGMLGAFVERHDYVRAQSDLSVHGAFRGKKMRRPVQMGTKRHTFFRHLAQFVQTENLEAPGVGENCARPGHEAMQPAHPADFLHSGPQVKMVGISQQNLDAKLLKNVLRNAFDRSQGPYRHEHRRFHDPVRRKQPSSAGCAALRIDLKESGHRWGL